MYLFKKEKVGQLHINKNAGSSLRHYLIDVFDHRVDETLMHFHAPLKSKYHLVPKDYNIIAIVRNPYARLVSIYSFRRKHYNKGETRRIIKNAYKMDFKSWFINTIKSSKDFHEQPTFYSLEVDGKIPDNVFVAKVETLQEDVYRFFTKINIKMDKKLNMINTSTHKPWNEYYDNELRQTVYDWDRWTFETFGYEK